MAKIIAVCGSPNGGKTTVAFKLAQEMYCNTDTGGVIFLSPSMTVPVLGLLFPNYTPDSLFSLGGVLDNTDISQESILAHLVTVKDMPNFGCLGYKSDENKHSYAKLTDDKVNAFFNVLSEMVGYVFVECTENDDDLISRKAINCADSVVLVLSPDLKGMTYYTANKRLFGSDDDRSFKVINSTDNDLFLPIEDVKAHLKNVSCTLPYSRQVRQQLLDGQLYMRVNDKKYRKELSNLIYKIM